ncbi:hypothetical protein PBI_SCTP2_474 [Salicola phage SCTP-2]|nr:hypothetical protein PBI_SCTP2_474 [Salicola phage SCTP-2]
MEKLQTFAGQSLSKCDFRELRKKIIEEVLAQMASEKSKNPFVTPEQFVVKHKARFGQVNSCLNELVEKRILKTPVEKQLETGRTQKFYYFNLTTKEVENVLNKMTRKNN